MALFFIVQGPDTVHEKSKQYANYIFCALSARLVIFVLSAQNRCFFNGIQCESLAWNKFSESSTFVFLKKCSDTSIFISSCAFFPKQKNFIQGVSKKSYNLTLIFFKWNTLGSHKMSKSLWSMDFSVHAIPQKFGDILKKIFRTLTMEDSSQIYIIFDEYKTPSLKERVHPSC